MDNSRYFQDIQKNFYALLEKLSQTTSPWSRWKIIRGFPNSTHFGKFDSLMVYVLVPSLRFTAIAQQGGDYSVGEFEISIGGWAQRVNGGVEEINIFSSQIYKLFSASQNWAGTTYDVTTDAVYTGTTLYDQGISIVSITGPNKILENTDENDFRNEFKIFFRS